MVRKLYLIAGLYAACVIGAVLSGCSIYDKEDLSKMVATSGDAECQADGAKNGEGDAEGKENRETRRKMRRVTRTQTGRVRVRI